MVVLPFKLRAVTTHVIESLKYKGYTQFIVKINWKLLCIKRFIVDEFDELFALSLFYID